MNAALQKEIAIHCAHDALVDVVNLQPHPRNYNTHPDKQVALLAKIIRYQGWRNPITVSNRSGYIVAGHARLEAAKLLGISDVPVDHQDFDTEADEVAHLTADNRIAELAEIDTSALRDDLEWLDDGAFDMDLTGFDAEALELFQVPDFPPGGEDEQGNLDQIAPIICPNCQHEFKK